MSGERATIEFEHDGRVARVRLAAPKANILDRAMIADLDRICDALAARDGLVAIVLGAEGPHFSFGASVEEHLPGQCAAMLAGLHALLVRMVGSPVPILVAAQGQCLGGGLELACAGNLIFAAQDARFGQPEIKLAVFAPAASCLLPERVGAARAEDLLFSGRTLDAAEALRIGLVTEVADDPAQAALAYFDKHLAGLSASSLRYAVRAVRGEAAAARVKSKLERVEKLYLEGLMSTRDAVEGLQAFVAKRPATWEHR